MLNAQYVTKWIEMKNKMEAQNFTWASLEEEDDVHQYMSLNVLEMKREQWNDIQEATKRIGNIVNKSYKIILADDALQAKLGLPVETLKLVKIPSDYFSYFTRFDLILNNEQIKVIEINCDTPTGYLETSVANKILCEDKGFKSPNNLEFNIFKAWRSITKSYGIGDYDTVHFTSYGWHDEDRETVLFNMKHSGLVNPKYVPVEDIIVNDDGLFDQDGQCIDYLYRLYPLEYLVEDETEDGLAIGKQFLKHIEEGNVQIINPPSAFLMQTKAVMGVIWNFLRENRTDLFTEEELNDIRQYFLPTYFDSEPFTGYEHSAIPFVEKPIFGREGGGVKIIGQDLNVVEADEEDWYQQWDKIYQEYVEMPEHTVNTWAGDYKGKLLVGSFLIGGEPSGVFLRVGEKITGNLSMFCGVAVTD
ncbi:glutathionylspermidine synthase family protein [Priestia aryabhattai]|uniref:glutathionylspermidine synthase family protein n=1 Tax=Priestia aryabhattai TaxID=412384 RepID=UPI00399F8004